VWLRRIKNLLELFGVLNEELLKALEGWELIHAVDLLVALSPFEVS
jgi:hypothetical protein